jgi:hypothetical protein
MPKELLAISRMNSFFAALRRVGWLKPSRRLGLRQTLQRLAAPTRGRKEASHFHAPLVGARSTEQAWQIPPSAALAASPSQSAFLSPSLVSGLSLSRLALSVGNEIHAAAADADLPRNGPPRQTPFTQ